MAGRETVAGPALLHSKFRLGWPIERILGHGRLYQLLTARDVCTTDAIE